MMVGICFGRDGDEKSVKRMFEPESNFIRS